MGWGRGKRRIVIALNHAMAHAVCTRLALMGTEERRPASCPLGWRRVLRWVPEASEN